MFAFVPIILEIFFVLLKPQELYEWLLPYKPLYTIPSFIIIGFLFDTLFDSDRYGRSVRLRAAPYLTAALVFYFWTLLTAAIKAPATVGGEALLFGTPMLMTLAIAHCVRSWKLYESLGMGLLGLSLFLCFVAIHQTTTPFTCHWVDPRDHSIVHYDGRPCSGPEAEIECVDEDIENGTKKLLPGETEKSYVCEHTGLMQTATVVGRVRFRGQVEDPNELSLAVSIGMPFAMGFYMRRRSVLRFLFLIVALGMIATCVFLTQSRGGQLTLMVCLGIFFCLKYGWKLGAIVGGSVGVPAITALAVLAGRSGAEAEASSLERTECLAVAVELTKQYPLFGVGKGLFGDYHFLTAHNSYMLVAAETGIVGFALWSTIMYMCIKIPLTGLRLLKGKKGPQVDRARTWASAGLASMVGLAVGSFFLSFTFHPILWIYVGVAGALAAVLRRDFPELRVRLSGKEIVGIIGADLALLAAILVYVRIKLH